MSYWTENIWPPLPQARAEEIEAGSPLTQAELDLGWCLYPERGLCHGPITLPRQRYHDLQHGLAPLTDEELKSGWHFCAEWDFLLIHKSWREAECCRCGT